MVALWFPKEELKADLEDQARKRLEEIQREAEKRRNAIVEGAQSKLNDQALQDTLSRFNQLVDPLFDKGRQALDGATQATEDVSERARQMVEEVQASAQAAPAALGEALAPKPPSPDGQPPQLPGQEGINNLTQGISGALGGLGQTPPSPTPEVPGQPSTPQPEVPPTPGMDGMAGPGAMSQSMFSAPGLGLGGLGGLSPRPAPPPGVAPSAPSMPGLPTPPPGMPQPPDEPPGFKPPGLDGAGLGNALAERIRGGMDAAGEGIGGMASGLGTQVDQRRDQAMELAQQSLQVAQQALEQKAQPLAQARDFLGEQYRVGSEARAEDLASGRSNVVAGEMSPVARTLAGLRRTQGWDESQDRLNRQRDELRAAAANGETEEYERLQAELRADTAAEGGILPAALRRAGATAGIGYLGATGLDPNAPGSEFAFKEERPVYDEDGKFTGQMQLVEAPTGAARIWRDAPEQLGTVLGREKTRELNRFMPPGAAIPLPQRNERGGERVQAGFGLATQGWNALGEILHGGVGEATDDEAAAAAARLAGDVLGPGGAVPGYIKTAATLGDVGRTALGSARLADNLPTAGRFAWEGAKEAAGRRGWVDMIHAGAVSAGIAAAPVAAKVTYENAIAAGMNPTEAAAQAIDIFNASAQLGDASDTVIGMGRGALRPARAAGAFLDRATEGLPDLAANINQGIRGTAQGVPAYLGRLGEELQGSESGVLWGNPPLQLPARNVEGLPARRAEGAIETRQATTKSEGQDTIRRESEIDWAGHTPREGETIDPETGTLSPSIEQIYLAAHAKGDLTDADLIRLGIGVPGDVGRLPGQGKKGEGLPGGLQGIPRVASFRHVGWKAKDVDVQITGPNEGTVTYKVPLVDDAALAAGGLKKKLRFGSAKKGDLRYEDMPTRADRAAEAAEDLEDMEEGATVPGGGTKVIVDANDQEVKELTDPRIQWQEKTTPITNTEGLTRDGKWKDGFNEKVTPIEYQRAVLARGMGMRNFYPEFGRFFRDEIAQGSQKLLKEASAIFGATASQASPETNLQRTLAVMAAARDFAMRIDPRTKKPVGRLPNLDELRILVAREWDVKRMREMPLVGKKDLGAFPAGGITDADLRKVIQIWKNGRADIGAGWKTPVFAQNVVSAAESLFIPRSVPDTHAFRGQGYTQTGGGPASSVNSSLQALGVTDANVHQLAKEFGLSYDQVQSALWYRYKEELAPFNATDIAQINNRAGTTDQLDPRWVAEAKVQDPWPTTDLKNPDGTPKLKADGTPETVRQGSLESTKQHNATLMQQFADVQKRWQEFSKQDTTTPQAADARLTFNGRAMGDMLTNPDEANDAKNRLSISTARIRLPEGEREAAAADTPPRDPTRLVQSQEVTPEQLKRATLKAEQEAPILVLPGDETALARLGYDPATGTIPDIANEGIRGIVVPQARQFNTGAPGEGTPQPTIRVIMPGASLETARYFGARMGQKLGTDEVMVTWPTGPDRGHPVLSVDSPSDAGWDADALQKAPWAQRLLEHGSLSADGRTIFITDLRGGAGLGDTPKVQSPEGALGTDFMSRAQGILRAAGVPDAEASRYARMSADFGSELIGGRDFARIVAAPPLSLSGDIGRTLAGRAGQRTFANPTGATTPGGPAGEDLPGALPGARNLREYAGPGIIATESTRTPTRPGALGLPEPDMSATAGQAAGAYAVHAPEQATYHNNPENWGSSFNPTQGNLENEKVYMVGAFPMRMWTVEGTHEVSQQQFEDFAAANQDLLTRFPELSIGTWKDRAPDGAPRVTLDLSLAVDNHDEAMALGELLRQDAIHQMDGHNDLATNKGRWGDKIGAEEDVINAIQRVRTEGAFGAGAEGASRASGEQLGAALGAGAAQRDGSPVGAAADTGLAGDQGGSLGDGTAGGALGSAIRAGLRRAGARDTLDENLQITQMAAGAAKGGLMGAEYNEEEDEQNPLKRAARVAGGVLLGATAGAASPNPVRLARALDRAGGGDALSRLSAVGRRLAGDEAGTLGAVSKGPGGEGTLPAPKSGELRGEQMGLGDLEDPENLTDLLVNPPKGLSGDQINEIGRAAFKRLRKGMTSEQTVQQREAERVRRVARRQEGLQKVDQATTADEAADAVAEAEDAAKRGEMPHSDADAVRARAARKIQQKSGQDGPPEPGAMDRQIEAARARREAEKVTRPAGPTREQEREGLGVARMEEEAPPRVEDPYEDVEAGGALTPEDEATQRAYIAAKRAQSQQGPLPPPLPPPVGRVDTPPPEGEPHPGRGPELGPAARAVEAEPAPPRVTSGSKAERDQAAARAKYQNRPSARVEGTTPVTSLETEAALVARPTEPAERGTPSLIAPDGTFLTRAQAAAQMARQSARPGGWAAIRDEWSEGLSDAGKLFAAAGHGIRVAPQQFEEALAQAGKGLSRRETWEGLPKNAREKLTAFRPEHIFDAMGTYQRINMVVTPEGFGRNFLSTTIGVPLRFYEAATAPLFDRMWGVLPGQGDRGPNAAHSYEAVAMAEGLYRSWAAGIANSMNVGRKGDQRLTQAQAGDDTGDFQDTAVGKAMGTFFRPMTATDAFLKTLNEGMEAYRLAYRQAKNEFDAGKLRHDGRSIRSRMMEIMTSPDQKFIDQVQQAGDYNTYNQKAGHLANLMEAFKNLPEGTPPAVKGAWKLMMNTVIPFVRISTNAMKYGLERTIPGGLASTAMGKGRLDRSERFAKMSEGALLLGGLWGAQQAGLIEVSGALPEDDTEREEWVLQGKTPFSMRIGDRWYNPQAVPGLFENVTMLGMMNDTKRKLDEKEAAGEEVGVGDYFSQIPGGVAQYLGQVGVRPAFGSVVNLLGSMTAGSEGQREYYREQLAKQSVGQVAPASGVMRQIGNWTDTTQRQAEGVAEQVAAIYPWWRENLPAKTNALGEEMQSETNRWIGAGLFSSKAASDTTQERKYRGSESARMDRDIDQAIRAVNAFENDRRGNPRPSMEQKRLARRYQSRLNPRRKKIDERVKKFENRREMDRLNYPASPFEFQIPGRFRREEEELVS